MGQLTPHDREIEAGAGFDQRELVDSEVTGDEVGTNMFPILFRTYRYPRFARKITGANSPASMVARRWCAVVLQPSPMMAWPGERGYGIYKPQQTSTAWIRSGWSGGEAWPRAWRHGSASTAVRSGVLAPVCRCWLNGQQCDLTITLDYP